MDATEAVASVEREPPSARACDGLVAALAGWTLVCNLVVFLGGSLHALLVAAGVALAAAAAWAVRARRRGRRAPSVAPGTTPNRESGRSWRLPAAALLASAALTAGFAAGGDVELLWWLAVAYLGVAAWFVGRRAAPAPPPALRSEAALWSLALAFGLLPLFAHRASPDDGYYVNVAVHAVDHPDEPLLKRDTLHGVAGLPLMYAVYRVHSFELLGASVAELSGLDALHVFHWLLPCFFGLFVVLAHAALLRLLLPRRWLAATAFVALFFVLEKEAPQSFGSFALLRLQQGKTAFLVVVAPLIALYGHRFAERPSRRGWALLCAAQVAAVGLTSTALWAAPLIGGIALLSGLAFRRRSLGTLALGLGASVHAVALGLAFVRSSLRESELDLSGDAGVQLIGRGKALIGAGGALVTAAWETVQGTGALAVLSLFALLGAWALCRSPGARRLAVAFPLGALLLVLNPYTALDVAAYVTGGPTYWRALWVVPLPALLAVVVLAPSSRVSSPALRALALLVPALLVFAFVTGFQRVGQGVRWEPFGLKVPVEAFAHAEAIAAAVPPESRVLAPRQVGTSLLQLPGGRQPLVSNRNWLNIQTERLGAAEADRRLRLLDYVVGMVQPTGSVLLAAAVARDDLRAVSFTRGTINTKAIRKTLEGLGFEALEKSELYETWVRP